MAFVLSLPNSLVSWSNSFSFSILKIKVFLELFDCWVETIVWFEGAKKLAPEWPDGDWPAEFKDERIELGGTGGGGGKTGAEFDVCEIDGCSVGGVGGGGNEIAEFCIVGGGGGGGRRGGLCIDDMLDLFWFLLSIKSKLCLESISFLLLILILLKSLFDKCLPLDGVGNMYSKIDLFNYKIF